MLPNVLFSGCRLKLWVEGGGHCLEDALEAERGRWLQNVEFGMGGSDELQELFRVLADEGLGVVAGDVVPLDAVLVDVVQDA